MARVNEQHLQHQGVTDVITFAYPREILPAALAEADDEGQVLGEILVCPSVAVEAAARLGHQPGEELALYLAHGILHLCGLDDHHPADRRRMRQAERRLMSAVRLEHQLPELFLGEAKSARPLDPPGTSGGRGVRA